MLGNLRDARIREADGVQHAATELRDPHRGMALTRFRCDGLRDNAAEQVEIDDAIELPAEAGGPSSKQNRILEIGPEKIHRTHGRSGSFGRSRSGAGRAPGGGRG